MPRQGIREPQQYLREARLNAGFVSMGTAATVVPFSPETIGRHERGDVIIQPQDAIIYAECYNSPDILPRYCADCPIGKRMGRTINERPLPHVTLRIRHLIQAGQDVANKLEEIAFDGQVDSSEQGEFEEALTYLKQLDQTINDILLIGCEMEKKKAVPAATGNGPRKRVR